MSEPARVSICIPHWQVEGLITVCLRAIRKQSRNYAVEVIVVDNGSKDGSLEYLRGLKWIRLIERPEETPGNWPSNVFTAWDCGIRAASAPYFITMHSDVILKSDTWLDPYLNRIGANPRVAGVGAWKLETKKPLYQFQKRAFGIPWRLLQNLFGKQKNISWYFHSSYPRDYCAMYRRDAILENDLTFRLLSGWGGGRAIAEQLWKAGFKTRMIPVRELMTKMVHVAHGTAAVAPEKPLANRRDQKRVVRTVHDLYQEDWIKALIEDTSLDA